MSLFLPWLKTHGFLSSVLLLLVVSQVSAPSPYMLPLGEMVVRWSNVVAVLLCFRFLGRV
jgi:hypothetical protein